MAEASAVDGSQAFVTLVTSNDYTIGALVLGHSLRQASTSKLLVALLTSSVSSANRFQIADVYDEVFVVEELHSEDTESLALLGRPTLGVTFTKLQAWTLTQFEKCVFLDADTLVLSNVDDIFDRDTDFAAAPDIGWPDCFNSGVFLFKPSRETYDALVALATAEGSFDGGDQGLLNAHYSSWSRGGPEQRLPFTYNMTANASYGYAPAFEQFRGDIKIVHFIGEHKPWKGMPPPGPGTYSVSQLVQRWWAAHDDYKSCVSESCSYKTLVGAQPRSPGPELAGPPPQLASTGAAAAAVATSPEDTHHPIHRPDAEYNPDAYLSSSGFSEVQALLDEQISSPPPTD
eukprot:m.66677 g.66677  ORF g.66677 m.66677 type:complete len:345 (-) comp13771_c0_seq2:1179-2213(-)